MRRPDQLSRHAARRAAPFGHPASSGDCAGVPPGAHSLRGARPVKNGVVISLARMNRILEVDLPNARVIVEPGVINLDVTGRVQPHEYFYAPDPSSQSVCSIGGNVAENSGGAHCLKYGFTTTHVLGLEVVPP